MAGDYSVCTFFGEAAQANEAPARWKVELDSVCSLQKDVKSAAKCKKTVAKYIADIGKESAEDFCKKINLADSSAPSAMSLDFLLNLRGPDNNSVCKYLIGHAKDLGVASEWKQAMQNSCQYFEPKEQEAKCTATVAKYLDDIAQKSPEEFCRELNLPDVQ